MTRVSILIALLGLLDTFSGCGRTLPIQVQEVQNRQPVAGVKVLHERAEWRLLGIVPYRYPILKDSKTTDEFGIVVFDGVRQNDIVTVIGWGGVNAERVWYSPLWPLEQVRSGPDTNLAHSYAEWNKTVSWKDETLLMIVPVELEPAQP